MQNKLLHIIGIIVIIGALIPTNIFVYATQDISYVEQVASIIDVTEQQEEIPEQYEIKLETNNEIDNKIVSNVADILGIESHEEDTYSLVFGEELAEFDAKYISTDVREYIDTDEDSILVDNNTEDIIELANNDIEENKDIEDNTSKEIDETIEEIEDNTENIEVEVIEEEVKTVIVEEETKAVIVATNINQDNALLEIDIPDENYSGTIVSLTEQDRDILERLVMGEAGGEGIEGAALVAQAIRDTMVYKGFDSVESVRKALSYSGTLTKEPNQDVKDACSYIFDQGGYAVKHKVFYFYAPKRVKSSFHESQQFIIEYGGHRFFSNK